MGSSDEEWLEARRGFQPKVMWLVQQEELLRKLEEDDAVYTERVPGF